MPHRRRRPAPGVLPGALLGLLLGALGALALPPLPVGRSAPPPPLVTVQAPLPPLRVLLAAVSGPGPAGPAQLPRGGRSIFPTYQVVAHYGTAGTPVLGVLGEGTPEQAADRLVRAAAPYGRASGRRLLPAFELIVSVAQRSPGPDGDYSAYVPDADIDRYLAQARRVRALVLLDLQPGLADPLVQVRHFEKYLRQPDVGLALDPEWQLSPGQRPGRQIGSMTADRVNAVSGWLAALRRRYDLPEKLFVVHQFQSRMLPDRPRLLTRPGLATVVHVDGFGGRGSKLDTYRTLASTGGGLHNGFKLFLDEDTDLFAPAEVMALRPAPELVTYQ